MTQRSGWPVTHPWAAATQTGSMATTEMHGRGRPRSAEADHAIIRAALTILAEHGYGELSMIGVAKRAGVSPATLYRRWSSKDDLVVAALGSVNPLCANPDTGTLEGDLGALLRGFVAAFTGEDGRLLRGLLSEMFTNPELAAMVRERLLLSGPDAATQVVVRAVERGEIPPVDPELALKLALGPVHLGFLTGEPMSDATIDVLVPMIVAALRAAPAPAPAPAPQGKPTRRSR